MKYLKHFISDDIPNIRKKGVYRISFKQKQNEYYIGSTICNSSNKKVGGFYTRISSHISNLRINKSFNSILQSYFNKYGEESLIVEIIEIVKDDISVKEIEIIETNYIKYYKNLGNKSLNIKEEARSSKNVIRSEETKRKISVSKSIDYYVYSLNGDFIKNIKTFELKEKFNIVTRFQNYKINNNIIIFKNNEFALEYFKKINEKLFIAYDIFTGEKIGQYNNIYDAFNICKDINFMSFSSNIYSGLSKSKRIGGYLWSRSNINNILDKIEPFKGNYRITYINQYDLNLNFIKTFSSQKEASEYTKINKKTINKGLGKIDGKSKGYIWKYN